jgi:ABC-type nitrate/sulfonate/bicarbonate transport system ATPase subunit
MLGGLPASRLDEILDVVGLSSRQRDKVKSYSMGMKQRLAVAIALLSDPDLLLLDEPANGLDPAGIVEMRDLLRQLAAFRQDGLHLQPRAGRGAADLRQGGHHQPRRARPAGTSG